ALGEVLQQRGHHAVVRVGWQLHLARYGLGLRPVLAGPHLVGAALSREGDLDLLGERGSALDEVVALQREDLLLREDRRLVVERAVAEAEQEARVHALGPRDLEEGAVRENFAARGAQRQEAAGDALDVAHRDRLPGRARGPDPE